MCGFFYQACANLESGVQTTRKRDCAKDPNIILEGFSRLTLYNLALLAQNDGLKMLGIQRDRGLSSYTESPSKSNDNESMKVTLMTLLEICVRCRCLFLRPLASFAGIRIFPQLPPSPFFSSSILQKSTWYDFHSLALRTPCRSGCIRFRPPVDFTLDTQAVLDSAICVNVYVSESKKRIP